MRYPHRPAAHHCQSGRTVHGSSNTGRPTMHRNRSRRLSGGHRGHNRYWQQDWRCSASLAQLNNCGRHRRLAKYGLAVDLGLYRGLKGYTPRRLRAQHPPLLDRRGVLLVANFLQQRCSSAQTSPQETAQTHCVLARSICAARALG